MTGSPNVLIPERSEPHPDKKAKIEEHQFKQGTLEKITKVKILHGR